MFSGLKIIPREELASLSSKPVDSKSRSSRKERKKSSRRVEKHSTKSRIHVDSSDDDRSERLEKSKRKEWSSDAFSSSPSQTENVSYSDFDEGSHGKENIDKKRKGMKQAVKQIKNSDDEVSIKYNKSLKKRKKCESSEDPLSSSDDLSGKDEKKGRREHEISYSKKRKKSLDENVSSGDFRDMANLEDKKIGRREKGLEWMVKPLNRAERMPAHNDDLPEKLEVEEVMKINSRELNPYLKDSNDSNREDTSQSTQPLSASVVGDGGASWRLKALKRAKEQAAREGRKLDKVVEERWGSLAQVTTSAASQSAAPSHAHLRAIKDRRERPMNNTSLNASLKQSEMREPIVRDSLSWRKGKVHKMSTEDAHIISEAASNINKFANDGNFLQGFNLRLKDVDSSCTSLGNSESRDDLRGEQVSSKNYSNEEHSSPMQFLSANQLAAKVLQLRMRGKHEEADKLLEESMSTNLKEDNRGCATEKDIVIRDIPSQRMKKIEDDADMHLAAKIVHDKQYSIYGRADDEYDFDDAPSTKKRRKRGVELEETSERTNITRRLLTQQERCNFCFENPSRPRHLVISIANFTYLMLPQWQPVVQGHCCIATLQHESSTRSVDDNVWDEIRNFKKCLIMMFRKQDKDVMFLETVMGLAQQRRHCLVECVPLPFDVSKQAPLYFKKAIDEAEDEWSQHNAKRLIDTAEKGLRASIPKDFPYFHVEFGLKRGFVHVIDDEKQFKSNFGLNVVRGMLQLSEEDMYRRRQLDSLENQKKAVTNFVREWGPFDWTKELD